MRLHGVHWFACFPSAVEFSDIHGNIRDLPAGHVREHLVQSTGLDLQRYGPDRYSHNKITAAFSKENWLTLCSGEAKW